MMESRMLLLALAFLGVSEVFVSAFTSTSNQAFNFNSVSRSRIVLNSRSDSQKNFASEGKQTDGTSSTTADNTRRNLIAGTAAAALSFLTMGADDAAMAVEERQGIEVTTFNGLIFNYRGGEYGGLDASTLNEPSVPYKEFIERMKAGEVEFVEFMAPAGDAAYVTFKPVDGQKSAPIRIGEGYPIEQPDGWSSPAFVVRTVKNEGIPYKFTVPALRKYK